MKKPVLSILVLLLLSVRSAGAGFEGPFQVKNQFPLFLPLDQPYLETAATEDSLSLSLSHSSVYMIKKSPGWNTDLDMELTELNIRVKKDLPGLFEAGLDLPVIRATAGFMDRPLAWYHRAFGFGDYGRKKRPRNDFMYQAGKDGLPLIEGDNDRTGFGDVRVSVKRKLLEGSTAVSLLADLELPTGNARVGYGNGSFDAGIALLLDRELSPEARLYGNLGAKAPGDLKALQTVELEPFVYGGIVLEYLYHPNLALLAQLSAQTSPYPDTGISEIDTPGVQLVLGGRYMTASGSYELSLSEDPNTSGAPDFSLNLTFKNRF